MTKPRTRFEPIHLALEDFLGREYLEAVCSARAFLCGEARDQLLRLASEKVDFWPESFERRLVELLPMVGRSCSSALAVTAEGATTDQFRSHARTELSPVSTLGWYRLTEEGRLFLISKSEHYHASLGHGFPGYRLIEHARRLGIPNATHNNTRGHVTRCLEQDLIRAAAGLRRGDDSSLHRLRQARSPGDLNRVINLETGSIAAEAALKLLLSRFYRTLGSSPSPRYAGRLPVLLVVGDARGRLLANYHGTTLLAQALRGLWPEVAAGLERQGLLAIRGVPVDDTEALGALFDRWDSPPYKVAGFVHELVLMNHGARLLQEDFVQQAHDLCAARDVPTVVDEIQTGIWSPQIFLFREYGIRPTIVVVGKGFPGGEFSASRVVFSADLDSLPQFGALVTSGQEELASLAYLITLRWAEANSAVTREVGDRYLARLQDLAARHPTKVAAVQGLRHLAGICFHDVPAGRAFVDALIRSGIDVSLEVQDGAPPCALTKLPLTMGHEAVDLLLERMESALAAI